MESSSSSQYKIPMVDMGAIAVGKEAEAASPAEWQRVAKELYEAFTSVGFVYLSNHGIADDQVNDIVNACSTFFKLDTDTKMKYNESSMTGSQGYVELNQETLGKERKVHELCEGYYIRRVSGVFPDSEVPQLRPSATALITSCRTLAYRVLTALALGLGLEKNFFVDTHQGICTDSPASSSALWINHYPPIPSTLPENVTRCAEHTDFGTITLLFQDSIGGLQVRTKDGKWEDVYPIPGTVFINAGDLLQVWTAKRILATEHRVIIPKEEARQRASRYSAVFFVDPDYDVLVRPLDGSTSPPPITAREHSLNMYAKMNKR